MADNINTVKQAHKILCMVTNLTNFANDGKIFLEINKKYPERNV